jgi:hypothetical protein
MKLDIISLPHPILRKDGGEIMGRFETHIGLTIGKEETVLTMSQILHNETIQELVSSGKASFFADISCSSTMYRKGVELPGDGSGRIKINSRDLRDTVVVTCLIIATQDIPRYKNLYTADFFEDRTFDIHKGEILGYSGNDSFEVDKDWETPGSKGSFFMFWKHSGKDVKYELGNDPILIELPENDYENMKKIKKSEDLKGVFISLYVYPAMLWVVSEFLSERSSTHNLRKWHKRLTDITKEEQYQRIGLSVENIPELVQKIFDYPLTRSLKDLDKVVEKKFME